MQKLHFSTTIKAPKKKVYNTMLDDSTFRVWTRAFNPKGSWFEGDWNEGSKIRFVGPDDNGKLEGMVSRVRDNRPYEYVSIEHLGVIHDNKEDTTSPEAKKWSPAFENYTFKERNGATELLVDMDTDDEHKKMFEDMWPKALERLKELAEHTA